VDPRLNYKNVLKSTINFVTVVFRAADEAPFLSQEQSDKYTKRSGCGAIRTKNDGHHFKLFG